MLVINPSRNIKPLVSARGGREHMNNPHEKRVRTREHTGKPLINREPRITFPKYLFKIQT